MNRGNREKNGKQHISTRGLGTTGSITTRNKASSAAATVAVFTKPKENLGTVGNSPNEIITSKGKIYDFGPWKVYHATILNKYDVTLYADTNEKVYLNGIEDGEFIATTFGKETILCGKHLQFIQTNKSILNSENNDQYIMIDVDTLEKATICLQDDKEEYITNWQAEGILQGKKVRGVETNKSEGKQKLIDVNSMKMISMHAKDSPEDVITTIGHYEMKYDIGGKSVLCIPLNEKRSFIDADTLEIVTIKDNASERITGCAPDSGMINNFKRPLGGRMTSRFEINNDENKHVVLYLDTLEKVSLKDHPDEVITDYTSHTRSKRESNQCVIAFAGDYGVRTSVGFANINYTSTVVAIYPDTLEKVAVEGYPDAIITGIETSYLGYHTVEASITINTTTTIQLVIEVDKLSSLHYLEIDPGAIAEKYQETL